MQMLGCKTRGFSFTRALLGIAADELHLCGDAAAVPLIQELLEVTGDDVQVSNSMELLFFYIMRCWISRNIVFLPVFGV